MKKNSAAAYALLIALMVALLTAQASESCFMAYPASQTGKNLWQGTHRISVWLLLLRLLFSIATPL